MPEEIQPFAEGESPGSWSAERMNELVGQLNAWRLATVKPEGAGKFVISDANVILEIKAPDGGTVTLDVAVWVAGSDAAPITYSPPMIRTIPGVTTNTGTFVCKVEHESSTTTPHLPATDPDFWLMLP